MAGKKSETILVTGGAGFIGSHVVDRLLSQGYGVVTIDNFNDSYNPKFKWENISSHIKNKNYTLVKQNICSSTALGSVLKSRNVDRIIHLAARAGVRASIENPLDYEKANILGTYNLLSLSQKYKIRQFIFASSSSVYGNALPPFNESHPASKQLSPYAATKRSAELACFTFNALHRLPVTILRLFSVYGPRGRPDMAPYLFAQAIGGKKPIIKYGDGSMARDWTYVTDIVDGFMKAIEKPVSFEIINLGNRQPITLNTLIKQIEKEYELHAIVKKKPSRPEESRITAANIFKAKKILRWSPKVTFEHGINKFVDWFKIYRLSQP